MPCALNIAHSRQSVRVGPVQQPGQRRIEDVALLWQCVEDPVDCWLNTQRGADLEYVRTAGMMMQHASHATCSLELEDTPGGPALAGANWQLALLAVGGFLQVGCQQLNRRFRAGHTSRQQFECRCYCLGTHDG